MTTEIFSHYRIELETKSEAHHTVRIYNLNGKNKYGLELPMSNYYYLKLEQAQKAIQDFKISIARHEADVLERREKRKAFANPAKVGDILHMQWGYDQTNNDYFQVLEVKGKMVVIQEIYQTHVDGSMYSHGMADEVKPSVNNFKKDSKPMKKFVRRYSDDNGYCVYMESYANAYLIDKNEKTYNSWYA